MKYPLFRILNIGMAILVILSLVVCPVVSSNISNDGDDNKDDTEEQEPDVKDGYTWTSILCMVGAGVATVAVVGATWYISLPIAGVAAATVGISSPVAVAAIAAVPTVITTGVFICNTPFPPDEVLDHWFDDGSNPPIFIPNPQPQPNSP
jgi:hypothetical protein